MGGMLWQGTGSPKETEVGVAARPEVGRRGNSSPKAPHFLLPGWTFLRQAARTEQREGKKRGRERDWWFEVEPVWRRNRDGENLSPRDCYVATPETHCG